MMPASSILFTILILMSPEEILREYSKIEALHPKYEDKDPYLYVICEKHDPKDLDDFISNIYYIGESSDGASKLRWLQHGVAARLRQEGSLSQSLGSPAELSKIIQDRWSRGEDLEVRVMPLKFNSTEFTQVLEHLAIQAVGVDNLTNEDNGSNHGYNPPANIKYKMGRNVLLNILKTSEKYSLTKQLTRRNHTVRNWWVTQTRQKFRELIVNEI